MFLCRGQWTHWLDLKKNGNIYVLFVHTFATGNTNTMYAIFFSIVPLVMVYVNLFSQLKSIVLTKRKTFLNIFAGWCSTINISLQLTVYVDIIVKQYGWDIFLWYSISPFNVQTNAKVFFFTFKLTSTIEVYFVLKYTVNSFLPV